MFKNGDSVSNAPSMGASWSITFVSENGEELCIGADIVSACSPVWRERLKINGNCDSSPRSEERCTLHELECFKSSLERSTQTINEREQAMLTMSTDFTDLNEDIERAIERLTGALPLLHKYECTNVVEMMQTLVKPVFPISHKPSPSSAGTFYSLYGTGLNPTPLAKWLTQAHFNYVIRLQELYGPDLLTNEMQMLLAGCVADPQAVAWTNMVYNVVMPNGSVVGRAIQKKKLKVHFVRPSVCPEALSEDTLHLEAFKITSETYSCIFAKELQKTNLVVTL